MVLGPRSAHRLRRAFRAEFFYRALSTAVVLSPKEWTPLKVTSIRPYNHDTSIFRLSFPSSSTSSGLSVASCITIQGIGREGTPVVRPYTPISPVHQLGSLDLLIKNYPKGNVSSYMHSLKEGDTVNVKGPFAKLDYQANKYKKIGMIAGGTGIAPMIQVLHAIMENANDTTQVSVVFANRGEEDILEREFLEALAEKRPGQLWVRHVLEKPGAAWTQSKGRVDVDLLRELMPSPMGERTMILVCGPPGFMEAVSGDKAPDKSQGPVAGFLKQIGYKQEQVYKF